MQDKITPIIVDTESGKTYAWCSCKQSKNFPYCDNSHVDSGKIPVIQTMSEGIRVAICACGKSDNIFCNGSHKYITE